MEDFFLKIVMISLYASILILIVMILRQIFRKAPRNLFLLLWGVVLIRLLCPVSFENVFSLIPEPNQTVQTVINSVENYDTEDTNFTIEDSSDTQNVSTNISSGTTVENNEQTVVDTNDNLMNFSISEYFLFIWILGIITGIIYSLIIYIKFKRKLHSSIKKEGYYVCNDLPQPCVTGFFKSKIYIPGNINESYLPYILAHESSHIKRKDYYIKLLWYAACIIYWFNPLIWIAFHLMSCDMEEACDETTIREFDIKEKMEYANILLACSIEKSKNLSIVLGLGSGSLKKRILNMKNNKGTKKKYIFLGILGCLIITMLFGFGYQPVKSAETTSNDSTSTDDTNSDIDLISGDEELDSMIKTATTTNSYDIENIGVEGEAVEEDGYEITVNQVTLTKQEGDWEDYGGMVSSMDENGLILSDECFVVINVTIEKVGESEKDFCFGNIDLACFYEDSLLLLNTDLDSVAGINDTDDPYTYCMDMEIGTKCNYDLVYVIDTDEMSDDIHFLLNINITGKVPRDYAPLEDEDATMIFLESMENIVDQLPN